MNKVFIWNVFIHLLSQVVSINSGLKLCAHGTCINACVRVCARVCVALCVAVTPGADAQGTASVRSPTEPAVANHEPTSSDETLGSRTAIRDVLEKPSTTQVDNFPASPTNCKHALVPGGRVSSSRSDGGPTYLRPLTTEATHRVRQGQRHAERQAQNRQRQQKILAAEARAREARREHDTQKQAAAREYHMRHRNVIQSHQKAIAQEVGAGNTQDETAGCKTCSMENRSAIALSALNRDVLSQTSWPEHPCMYAIEDVRWITVGSLCHRWTI
eukprot:m.735733 g.735733  ORF g.735733 m.735733 type:complete len:273 (-) comp23093_c0_seq3:1027-1845(-)